MSRHNNLGGRGVCLRVDAPWSRLLLLRQKTIETRNYALPPECQGVWVALLEVPACASKARPGPLGGETLVGWVKFGRSTCYTSREAWEAERHLHLVPPNASPQQYGWPERGNRLEKWRWPVLDCHTALYRVAPPRLVPITRSLYWLDWSQSRSRIVLSPRFESVVGACGTQLARYEGSSTLAVVADFDHTLTQYAAPRDTGSRGGSEECHDIIFNHAQLGPKFDAEVAPLVQLASADKIATEPNEIGVCGGHR